MDKGKRHKSVARGKARWHASRLEGVAKNRGIKRSLKQKGKRAEHRLRKIVRTRVSKRARRWARFDLAHPHRGSTSVRSAAHQATRRA